MQHGIRPVYGTTTGYACETNCAELPATLPAWIKFGKKIDFYCHDIEPNMDYRMYFHTMQARDNFMRFMQDMQRAHAHMYGQKKPKVGRLRVAQNCEPGVCEQIKAHLACNPFAVVTASRQKEK